MLQYFGKLPDSVQLPVGPGNTIPPAAFVLLQTSNGSTVRMSRNLVEKFGCITESDLQLYDREILQFSMSPQSSPDVEPTIQVLGLRESDLNELLFFATLRLDEIPLHEISLAELPLSERLLQGLVLAYRVQWLSLSQALSKAVANIVKGKTPEEIRRTFNIKNDFTPEEEERVRKENEWCEER